MLRTIKDYARLFGLFIGAVILFVRLVLGFPPKEYRELVGAECSEPVDNQPEPRHRRLDEKIEIDPLILSVKDQIVNGQHNAAEFDFEAIKDSMLRGAAYTRSAFITMFPSMQRVSIPLWTFTYGRKISVLIYVDFQTAAEGIVPVLLKEEEEKLRNFGRASKCFLN